MILCRNPENISSPDNKTDVFLGQQLSSIKLSCLRGWSTLANNCGSTPSRSRWMYEFSCLICFRSYFMNSFVAVFSTQLLCSSLLIRPVFQFRRLFLLFRRDAAPASMTNFLLTVTCTDCSIFQHSIETASVTTEALEIFRNAMVAASHGATTVWALLA